MSERIHALAQLVLGKTSLEECSIEELQHLIKRYPYFAPAHFLLLQKLKAAGSTDVEAQERKAILYFHDPLQFDSFLSAERFYFDESTIAAYTPENGQVNTTAYERETDETSKTNEPAFGQQNVTDTTEINAEALTAETEELPAAEPEHSGEPSFFFAEQTNIEQATTVAPDAFTVPDESLSTPVGFAPATAEDASVPETSATAGDELQEPATATEMPGRESESTADEATDENNLQELVREENPEEAPVAGAGEPDPGEAVGPVENRTDNGGDRWSPAIGAALSKPVESAGLSFEPYHTVDYFASQGIKISAEELPKDKLTKQLRSFTDWLKVMKRLPAAEMARVPESLAEKSVETMASHSVEESNVITEAMAEVWVKQGNRVKAIETYNKLSLLNPSKKAYFAAKIENLKGT